MEEKTRNEIQDIIAKHYSEILSELEEIADTDNLALSISVNGDNFSIGLAGL